MMLATIRSSGQLFTAILDPTHRMTKSKGKPTETDFLRQQNTFVAEATTNIWGDDADFALLESEAFRKTGTDDVRHLARRVDDKLVKTVIPVREHSAPFERRHALPSRPNFSAYRNCRGRCGGFYIRRNLDLEKDIVAPCVVD
jgi:hypothetical protein